MSEHKIICGDCLRILPTLPTSTCLFSDPPDNLGLTYKGGVSDNRSDYMDWLTNGVIATALRHDPKVFWLSHYYKHLSDILGWFSGWRTSRPYEWQVRLFLWRFAFGQHRDSDFGNGYRPILRFSRPGTKWYTDSVRVPSARQTKYHDKRANAAGRVPDDVFDFPRVCGTFHERRAWHVNQHPIALLKRIVASSCQPGDSVIDMFAGTGSCARACKELGVTCTSIEISPIYCQHLREEIGETLSGNIFGCNT
jgi:site-specific DNA-methyltransferase (adenine-specific)